MLECQRGDGHWVFELEADATIPAEYVLLRHYRGEPRDTDLEQKIAVYLRRIQGKHGGWPLYHQGGFDMSASVKAYFALKMIGDSPDAPHMRQAREAILTRGGAVHCNVFTRVLLSLYGILDGRSVPEMPVEILCLPKLVSVPSVQSVVLGAHGARAAAGFAGSASARQKPLGVTIDELFLGAAAVDRTGGEGAASTLGLVCAFSRHRCRPSTRVRLFPQRLRQRAIDRAVALSTERLTATMVSARFFRPWRMRR